jgi:hypothetical protein
VHQKASIKQKKLFQFVIKILRVVTSAKINIPTTLSNLGIIFGGYVYCITPYLLFPAAIYRTFTAMDDGTSSRAIHAYGHNE